MSKEAIKAIVENEENVDEMLTASVKFHITEAYRSIVGINQVVHESEQESVFTEQQIEEFHQMFLDEGIGRTLGKVVGAIIGGGLVSQVGGLVGYTAGGGVWILAYALGLVAPLSIAPLSMMPFLAAGAVAGALYGLYKGGVLGWQAVKKMQKTPTVLIAEKLIKVTNERDKLLKKVQIAAEQAKEDVSSIQKIEQLTREQEKLGRDLSAAVKADVKQDLVGPSDLQHYLNIADLASSGKLTYIEK